MIRKPKRRRKKQSFRLELLIIFGGILIFGSGIYLLNQDTQSTSDVAVFEQRLKSLRRMHTVNQTYRSVIYTEEKNFWRGKKLVLFSVEYNVIAGVDFSKELSIRRLPGAVIEVRMPPAEVFSSDADEGSIRQMLLREGLINNPIRRGDYMPQIAAQGRANRQNAIESGILNHAQINAEEAVRRILSFGGIQNVQFVSPLMEIPFLETSDDQD